ncbi:NAD(P)H-binding protein [Nocardia sp. BMG51109]|uniref:NAD(P)H-binding protein n=1 Tax=Nocardia sp. BMG51109 TaxID=1056816 RepID=UPI00046373BF|nr:NAD(P)H-binding protein [Nocardia sp. BMG51109]
MLVITAPTGNIGHRVLDLVLAGDRPVRVIARDPSRLPAGVRERAEVVPGSHGDPDVLARAFAGADSVFWLLPNDLAAAGVDDSYLDFTRPAIEALRTHEVRRVVAVSALGRGTAREQRAGYVTGSLKMDDLIASTGVAFRALANPSFMDNVARQANSIKENGVFADVVAPDLRLPTVATRDIATVAARLLLDDTWTGQAEVPLLGPEDLAPNEMAAILSDVLGIPVKYQQISGAALREQLVGRGVSAAMADGMLEMMTAKNNGLDLGVTRTPQHAIDTPTTFRQWCADVLAPRAAA